MRRHQHTLVHPYTHAHNNDSNSPLITGPSTLRVRNSAYTEPQQLFDTAHMN